MLMLYCALYQVCCIVRSVSANVFAFGIALEILSIPKCDSSKIVPNYVISEIANLTNSALDVEWNVFYEN